MVTLTGDYEILYERFMERNGKPERHRGHVVNDCDPEKEDTRPAVIFLWRSNFPLPKYTVNGTIAMKNEALIQKRLRS